MSHRINRDLVPLLDNNGRVIGWHTVRAHGSLATKQLPQNIAQVDRQFRVATGRDGALMRYVTAGVVHGSAVATITLESPRLTALSGGKGLFAVMTANGYDGLVTEEPAIILGVSAGDCPPLVGIAERGRQKAAFVAHCGYKPLLEGIIANLVAALRTIGLPSDSVQMAIGPGICQNCYEVGEEVAGLFEGAVGPKVVDRYEGRPHVDLRQAIVELATASGIKKENIRIPLPSEMCTRHGEWADRLFSYRGGDKEGRFMAISALTPR